MDSTAQIKHCKIAALYGTQEKEAWSGLWRGHNDAALRPSRGFIFLSNLKYPRADSHIAIQQDEFTNATHLIRLSFSSVWKITNE